MMGNMNGEQIKSFWHHVRELPPWKQNPILGDESQNLENSLVCNSMVMGQSFIEMMNISAIHLAVSSQALGSLVM